MKRFLMTTLVAGMAVLGARDAEAQGLSFSLRGGGGSAMGDFARSASSTSDPSAFVAGAKSGFGMGVDATLSFTRGMGLYAGFDRVAFACDDSACGSDGEYNLAGVTAGVHLAPVRLASLTPWVRAGVTFNELKGTYGAAGNQLASARAPGYELSAGVNVPVLGMLSLAPQVRYVGQNPKVKVPGIDAPQAEQSIGYLVFNLGLGIQAPFGGLGR